MLPERVRIASIAITRRKAGRLTPEATGAAGEITPRIVAEALAIGAGRGAAAGLINEVTRLRASVVFL